MEYLVIGLSNNPNVIFLKEVEALLPANKVFSGGVRHYELVKKHLPINHLWIEIKGEMKSLFEQYKSYKTIVVFASGDPLFYGFAQTIQKFDPQAEIKVYPWFNSLQILCQKALIPYSKIVNTSIHGRPWDELDTALIMQSDLIGVLTDLQKSPKDIAHRMLDYRFDNYIMVVGEALEGASEQIHCLELSEVVAKSFYFLNCVILKKIFPKEKPFGIPDNKFEGLRNRPNMITKMSVRLATLSFLALNNRDTFWDIGFCTGSICIEAKKQFPHLKVIAFEKRDECDALFEKNARTHSVPGIVKVMGDFFDQDLTSYAPPDAVFIGGHGNRLEDLISKVDQFLKIGGRIAMNVVLKESKDIFINKVKELKYNLLDSMQLKVDDHNSILILTAQK